MSRPLQEDGRLHGVLVGCRREDGRWLMIRRSAHVAAPGMVAFPGGAVEPGEDMAAAAMREFREELGAEAALLGLVWHFVCDDRPLTLWGYLGRLATDAFDPDPAEVSEVLWLNAEEAAAHPDVLVNSDKFIAALEAAHRF